MNRLFEIAKELGDIARKRAEIKNVLSILDETKENWEKQKTPEGGWPGKNAEEREIAKWKVLYMDDNLDEIRASIKEKNITLTHLEADREALIAERDAWQWTIRDRECIATGIDGAFEMMQAWLDKTIPPPAPIVQPEPDYVALDLDKMRQDGETPDETLTMSLDDDPPF